MRPYEIGIGAYSKVNIKYFKPLTYDYYENSLILITKTLKKNSINFVEKFIKKVVSGI